LTDTPSKLAELLAECQTHGMRLLSAGDGGLTIDTPEGALTPDLLSRLRTHKDALLALLLATPEAPSIDRNSANAVWHAALDRLEGNPLFPPDMVEALRTAEVQWDDDARRDIRQK
jgi:hypothetical protein